ncbi:MAG: nucleotidyltransferase domain-containing protein [archaeon]
MAKKSKKKVVVRMKMKTVKNKEKLFELPTAVKRSEVMDSHKGEETLRHVALKEISLVYDFSLKVVREFGSLIKSVVVFGSFARGNIGEKSDIDIMIIIDDASVEITPDIIGFYNKELDSILKKEGSVLKFHVTTVSLSDFFDTVRRGDPLIINILRTGLPVIDAGFFAPMKLLLKHGKIRPTWEAIELGKNRARYHMNDYSNATSVAATSLYWAAVEATHSALMTKGSTPASPEKISEEMARTGIGSEEDRKAYQGVFDLMKSIVHRQKFEVSPEELRFWKDAVGKLIENMDAVCASYKE